MRELQKPNLAILTSGHSLALEELLRAERNAELEANLNLIISSNGVEESLSKIGASVLRINSVDFPGGRGKRGEQTLEEAEIIAKHLVAEEIGVVALIGYSKIPRGEFLGSWALEQKTGYENPFAAKIVRSHQGPLPMTYALSGRDIQRAVLDSGMEYSAHTMHAVTKEHSPHRIFTQHNVKVRRSETVKTLSQEVALEEAANIVSDVNFFITKRLERQELTNKDISIKISSNE